MKINKKIKVLLVFTISIILLYVFFTKDTDEGFKCTSGQIKVWSNCWCSYVCRNKEYTKIIRGDCARFCGDIDNEKGIIYYIKNSYDYVGNNYVSIIKFFLAYLPIVSIIIFLYFLYKRYKD
jgi:hypothetical protein